MKTKLKTIKNLSKGLMVLALAGSINTANAQEKESNFKMGFNADGYFKIDPSKRNENSKTRFSNSLNSFELGMASFDVQHKSGKVTTYIDLGAGKRADAFSSNSVNSEFFIKQAYISVEVADGLSLTGGSFKKHIGYEQINVVDNANYSMSYAFSNTNFFNTGLKLDYKMDLFNFMIGVGNAADFKSAIDAKSNKKNYFGQFGYNRENTKFIYGFQTVGTNDYPNNIIQNDVIVEHKFNDKITAAINFSNYNYNMSSSRSWNSLAGYVKYKLNEKVNLNYRGEFFETDKQIRNRMAFDYGGGSVFSNTFTGNYKVGAFTIIPEFRLDYASERIFTLNKKTSNFNTFFLIGTTYKF